MRHSSNSDNNETKNEKGKIYVLYSHIGNYVITPLEMDGYSIILWYTKYFVRHFINAVIFILLSFAKTMSKLPRKHTVTEISSKRQFSVIVTTGFQCKTLRSYF